MYLSIEQKKHVLAVSDEPRVLAELKMELMELFDVSIAATSSAVFNALDMYSMAVIVIHIGENRDNAFAVFAEISEAAKSKGVPVMFLADHDDATDEMSAFDVGAVDYAIRRHGGSDSLRRRISLRIRASESESREPAPMSPIDADETVLIGKTILVVDDVDLNRELIDGMLGDIDGLTLDFAVDGKDAVKKFARAPERYSLILMDIQMPVMDGIYATKTIRRLNYENAREIPIVALSADDEEWDVEAYLNSGMNDHIKKPLTYDQLINTIVKHCG